MPGAQPSRVVAVVGAGISGLAAADAVRRHAAPAEVVVLEASDRVGGKLRREEVAGVLVDTGAEALLNRRPEAVDLARRHGLADDLVHPATLAASVWSRGVLHRMPRSVMGVPSDAEDLAASGLLSEAGLARALEERHLPRLELGEEDVSLGWLVGQRFGEEVVERMVEPMLGGVYAGHARELSARATAPQVVALLDEDASMLRAAARTRVEASPSQDRPVFAGIVGGVSRLPEAVAATLDVCTRTTVREVSRRADGRWDLVAGSAADPFRLTADAVVLATPAPATARLLAGVAPGAAAELRAVEYASVALVTLAFRAGDVPALTGSGFLTAPADGRTVKGSTYSFAKWPWVRTAGDGLLLIRVSVGRHREEHVLQVPDQELVAASLGDLRDAVGLVATPVDAHVQRWGGALPQYAVGHRGRVARIQAAVGRVPGLAVCGAAYDGLGVPACIASGHQAAARVLEGLRALGG